MCKLSIIIPIFNTGRFLKRCINSVADQTLKDIEIILVDDGSTDNSGNICDEFAQKDSRVKVIHKDNEGVSVARNMGINIAQGDYIGFVDSDDWLDADMYEALYNAAKENGADIVMCDAVTKYEKEEDEADTITQLLETKILKKEDISPSLLLEMAGSVWRCIYKKSLISENKIEFPQNLKISEDRIFNIYAFGYCKSAYYIKKAYYNRFVRKGSAVNSYREDIMDIALDGRKRTMEALDTAWDGQEAYKTEYENHIIISAYSAINNAFYKESPLRLREKYYEVKSICNVDEVRNGIIKLQKNDLRARLIIKRRAMALCLIAMILNKRHGR